VNDRCTRRAGATGPLRLAAAAEIAAAWIEAAGRFDLSAARGVLMAGSVDANARPEPARDRRPKAIRA
jgi:hypothetical protein